MNDASSSKNIAQETQQIGRLMSALIGLRDWIDARLPIVAAWKKHMSEYYAPKNFNIWYFFGVLSLLVLVIQLLTGIWLTMNYTPSADAAFASIEYIMRDVDYGWLLRYLHSTGASAFFLCRVSPHVSWNHVWLLQEAARITLGIRYGYLPGING
jgi:hypothetical protein